MIKTIDDGTDMGARPIDLPVGKEDGYYELRLESIGGLGANLCGKLLGQLGAELLLNAAAFSDYGSEKRGSPVRSHIRWSTPDREILHNSPVEHPRVLVLFHEALAKASRLTAGLSPDCTLVVNTADSPEAVRRWTGLYGGRVCCIDALGIALDCKSRMNMVMLGAIVRAMGFVPIESARRLVEKTLGKKYPAMLEANLRGLLQGYERVTEQQFSPDPQYAPANDRKSQVRWGYANAPIGGVNPHFGSSASNDLSPSREGYLPLYLPEKCIHCGLCDTTCPDMVFCFAPGEYRGQRMIVNHGPDYHYCKGCLRCVDVCPVGALVAGKEKEHPRPKHFARCNGLLTDQSELQPSGADASVTGEAYLDEKRVDGGLL